MRDDALQRTHSQELADQLLPEVTEHSKYRNGIITASALAFSVPFLAEEMLKVSTSTLAN